MSQPDRLPAPAAPPAVATPADAVAAGYRAAADAPATLRAYWADLACYRAWCTAEARNALPATPQTVGAYLAALASRYALATLRRRLAASAIARWRGVVRADWMRHPAGMLRLRRARLLRLIAYPGAPFARSPGLPLLALLMLPGCQAVLTEATSTVAGIGGASVASGVGADAAVTTGIGLGVQALGRAGLQYAQRLTHRAEQNHIAAVAGPLPVGGVGGWATDHTIPVEANERGQVAVSRVISTGTLECKEIVFSVDTGRDEQLRRGFYLAAICRDGDTWKWASAEPATERWGSLQ